MSTKLPDGVAELLADRVDSFEKLELIVALHAAPRATMSLDELCRTLKLARDVVREAALQLRAASLVELTSVDDVQLLPPTKSERAAVTDLVQVYADDRLALVKAMSELSVNRIRSMAARTFAEAFVIRKKPPKGDDNG